MPQINLKNEHVQTFQRHTTSVWILKLKLNDFQFVQKHKRDRYRFVVLKMYL